MAETAAYELSENAALTLLLHASKYPSCTVNGVLLGKARSSEGGGFLISTVIPLFHRSHVFAPCVETALDQVRLAGGFASAPRGFDALAASAAFAADVCCTRLVVLPLLMFAAPAWLSCQPPPGPPT